MNFTGFLCILQTHEELLTIPDHPLFRCLLCAKSHALSFSFLSHKSQPINALIASPSVCAHGPTATVAQLSTRFKPHARRYFRDILEGRRKVEVVAAVVDRLISAAMPTVAICFNGPILPAVAPMCLGGMYT